jgi:hypothetical protein
MQSSAPLDIIRFLQEGDAPYTNTMPKLDDQISTLQERLKQLKLRQQRVDARKRAIETMRERKAETRRQFVVGSVILAKVQEGAMDPKQLRDWLDQTLTRRDDRALFHLAPKDEPLPDAMSTAAAALAPAEGAGAGAEALTGE